MTVYTWQRYRRDERDTRFRKVCEALGYEPDTMIGGNALDPETHREKLSGLLSRLQLGDVLLIEKLSDLTEVPSEAPPVLTKLAANPATIFVCDLSKSAPVTTYAHIVSSAAQSFVPLEKEIRDLKAELETVNERIADYVSIASEALHQRYAALYKRGPVTLVEELLKPPRDLRDAEPVASDERIVAILEAARQRRGFTYEQLSALLGRSVSTIHRALTTGRGPLIMDLIRLLVGGGFPANGAGF